MRTPPAAWRQTRLGVRLGTQWSVVPAVAAALLATASLAQTTRPAATHEYDLKAVFLFNFTQFVEWPRDAFADASSPLTIGVLGADPFGDRLDEIVAGETIHGRPVVVRRYLSMDQVESCHILFISASESPRLDRILGALGHRSILTVGETKDFTSRSGIIGFELAQRRLRLRINVAAANAARLTISSKLLRQAVVVRSGGG